MSRNGFTVLVLGYTGDEVMAFKVDYILAFDRMEAELRADHRRVSVRHAPQAPAVVNRQPSGALVRGVQSLLVMLDTRMSHLSEPARQTMYASALKLINIEVPEPVVQKGHSSTELAQLFGLAPTVFGKKVKHLKIDGLYGEYRLTTAPHGKQVEQFHWNDAGRQAVISFMTGSAPSNLLDDNSDDC